MRSKELLRSLFLFVILFLGVNLYTLKIVSMSMLNVINFGLLIVYISSVFLLPLIGNSFKIRLKKGKYFFKYPVLGFITASIVSAFISGIYMDQSLWESIEISRFVFFYVLYFFLGSMDYSKKEIDFVVTILGLVFVSVYLLGTLTKNSFISATILIERGTVRISLPGLLFLIYAYFLHLSNFFKVKKLVSGLLSFLFLGCIFLTGTRSILFPVLIFSILFILRESKFTGFQLSILLFPILIVFIFAFKGVIFGLIDNMLELKTKKRSNITVRQDAVGFFFKQLFPNSINYILGNGMPGYSAYGRKISRFQTFLGYYQSDIGVLADYLRFGLVYIFSILVVFFKVFKLKLEENSQFIKYFFGFMLITSVTLSHFGNSTALIVVCVVLWRIDSVRAYEGKT